LSKGSQNITTPIHLVDLVSYFWASVKLFSAFFQLSDFSECKGMKTKAQSVIGICILYGMIKSAFSDFSMHSKNLS